MNILNKFRKKHKNWTYNRVDERSNIKMTDFFLKLKKILFTSSFRKKLERAAESRKKTEIDKILYRTKKIPGLIF